MLRKSLSNAPFWNWRFQIEEGNTKQAPARACVPREGMFYLQASEDHFVLVPLPLYAFPAVGFAWKKIVI
jgi:hypothetical protein